MGRGYKDTPYPSHRYEVRHYIQWKKENAEYLDGKAKFMKSAAYKRMSSDEKDIYTMTYQAELEQSIEDDKRWRKQLGWDKNV